MYGLVMRIAYGYALRMPGESADMVHGRVFNWNEITVGLL